MVTSGLPPAPGIGPLSAADRKLAAKVVWRGIVRIVAMVILVLAAYTVMPTGTDDWWWAAIPMTVLGLAVFVAVFYRQLKKVAQADHPVLRAIEAIVFTLLLFLVLFASVAVQLEAQVSGSYSEPLDKVDAFYFAVTTLATVGYGDITPVTTTARLVVTLQMLGNLVLLGVAVRLVGRATQRERGDPHESDAG
jgi:hypothetical protein